MALGALSMLFEPSTLSCACHLAVQLMSGKEICGRILGTIILLLVISVDRLSDIPEGAEF